MIQNKVKKYLVRNKKEEIQKWKKINNFNN